MIPETCFTLDTEVTPMPFKFDKGKVFRGNIPLFSGKSKHEDVDQLRKIYNVSRVVLLCSDDECFRMAKTDLRKLYETHDYDVTYYPINSHRLPSPKELEDLIDKIHTYLSKGETLFVHCNAGQGRTGLVLACLARRVFGFSGNEAIRWVQSHIPKSLAMSSQRQLVRDYFPPCVFETDEELTATQNAIDRIQTDPCGADSILSLEEASSITTTKKAFAFTLNAEVTPMPYTLDKGEVLRGNYPVVTESTGHQLLQYRSSYGIDRIILLLTNREMERVCGVNLKKLYEEWGYQVTHFPIVDYGVPRMESLRLLIKQTLIQLSRDETILVHCHAGRGRTGLILACLARSIFGFGGNEAIRWVRSHVDGALKSANQRQMVRDFIPGPAESDEEFLPVISPIAAQDLNFRLDLEDYINSDSQESPALPSAFNIEEVPEPPLSSKKKPPSQALEPRAEVKRQPVKLEKQKKSPHISCFPCSLM